jgi:hypothetical protein
VSLGVAALDRARGLRAGLAANSAHATRRSRRPSAPPAMSRVCVKGLPKGVGEDALRKHFASLGADMTDVKVARTR